MAIQSYTEKLILNNRFEGTLSKTPIVPGSFFSIGGSVVDNGEGTFSYSSSLSATPYGSIDYTTGLVSVREEYLDRITHYTDETTGQPCFDVSYQYGIRDEQTINAKLRLRYDTFTNWTNKNPLLKSGEVAVVEVQSTDNTREVTSTVILSKVGNGVDKFSALPWASANAADVYPWAKAETKPTYTLEEIPNADAIIKSTVSQSAVLYSESQMLTVAEQGQARFNISAMYENAILPYAKTYLQSIDTTSQQTFTINIETDTVKRYNIYSVKVTDTDGNEILCDLRYEDYTRSNGTIGKCTIGLHFSEKLNSYSVVTVLYGEEENN